MNTIYPNTTCRCRISERGITSILVNLYLPHPEIEKELEKFSWEQPQATDTAKKAASSTLKSLEEAEKAVLRKVFAHLMIETWKEFIQGPQLTAEGLKRLETNTCGDRNKPIILYHNYNFHLVRKENNDQVELEVLNVDASKWDKLKMRVDEPAPAFKLFDIFIERWIQGESRGSLDPAGFASN
ncbi:hypothetical protein OROMI_017712 [Orobanche minor]